jgi:hypothetical protein
MIELQEEDYHSIAPVTQSNPSLKQTVNDSMEAKNEGHATSASELLRNPFL